MGANRFAKITDSYWLDMVFMGLMSPENLHADGERSPAAALVEANRLLTDYNTRKRELELAGV